MSKSVLVCMPVYGQVAPETVRSMLAIERAFHTNPDHMRKLGLTAIEWKMLEGQSLITRARNKLVHAFMKTSFTHLMFLDSDIGLRFSDFFDLIRADVDLIGAPYPRKVDGGSLCIRGGRISSSYRGSNSDFFCGFCQIIPATHTHNGPYIATGTMLVRREVFEKLAPHVPACLQDGEKSRAFFTTPIGEDGNELPEDYAFCRAWHQIGGKIHALTRAHVSHTGQKTWTTKGIYEDE